MRITTLSPSSAAAAVAACCAAVLISTACTSDAEKPSTAAASTASATTPAGTPASSPTGGPAAAGTPTPRVSARPAPFQQEVRYAGGISVQASAVRQGVVTAVGPGQATGKPVTTFALVFTNRSTTPLDLTRVTVEVQYGKPPQNAAPVYDATAQDFSTRVPPGTRAKATYAFSIPVAELGQVTMRVRFDPEYGAATFVGRIAPPK